MFPLLRRLIATSILASTLPGMLGWAHPACEDREQPTVQAAAPDATHDAHASMSSSQGMHERSDEAPDPCHSLNEHTKQGEQGEQKRGDHPQACALVAHCASAVPAPFIALAVALVAPQSPYDAGDTIPRSAAPAPAFRPPRA